ncbi:MAG: hydroxysqualene dehydroxylase HpnE [Betaproteobacteria bacterium]
MRVAVVGAGWAGCAAAVHALRLGHQVELIEAARQPGGRARRLALEHGGQRLNLDNGQHILIGAYAETLQLMRELGVDLQQHLMRTPLSLRFAQGRGLCLPAWPRWSPLAVALGVLRARGWSLSDKLALLLRARHWQAQGFVCEEQASVQALCAGLPPTVMRELIEPLCVSALNTPAERASGQVFLRVMQDALLGNAGGSDLLLPRRDLGALLPDAALRQLEQAGQQVRLGQRVRALARSGAQWQLQWGAEQAGEASLFDAVVLACPASEAARLLQPLPAAAPWQRLAGALQYEAIATVYAWAPGVQLAQAMLALDEGAGGLGASAQFVFDRGQLGGPAGLLAFVVSASTQDRTALEAGVQEQAQQQLGLGGLELLQTVIERRATFACTPGLQRPTMQVLPGDASLLACGDYVQGPYPATLEGAVRSGLAAAAALRR